MGGKAKIKLMCRDYKKILKTIPSKEIIDIYNDSYPFSDYDINSIELPIFIKEYELRTEKIKKDRDRKINDILCQDQKK